jgi:hypothetical protein
VDKQPSRLPPSAREVLKLARTDKRAAGNALSELSLAEQVALVCEAPLAMRSSMLGLADHPDAIIPLIPEAELCFTVKAVGLEDAGWILEHASSEQIIACADLDAWQGLVPDLPAFAHWVSILAHAGDSALLRAGQSFDAELTVLYLRDQIEVELKPNDDQSWQEPEGTQTLEGQFYFRARDPSGELAPLVQLLRVLFQEDYWLYFRLMQGVVWELPSGLEEWALRWRAGRLEDLGFPPWDSAMRIYGFLRPDKRAELQEATRPLDISEWHLPMNIPQLPIAADSQHLLFRIVGELSEDERQGFFFAFIGLANQVAVADRMPLGEADTLPLAIEKAATVASAGLSLIAGANGLGGAEVLRRTSLERLFRVGASEDPEQLPFGRPEGSGMSETSSDAS